MKILMIQGIGEEIILCLVLAERVHKSNFPKAVRSP